MKDTGVRWNVAEGEWEHRCEECSRRNRKSFWPLTHDFWDYRRGMRMCRACINERMAAEKRERYRTSAAYRDEKKRKSREYWAASRPVNSVIGRAKWQEFKAKREQMDELELARLRELSAERQRRYRARRRQERSA